MSAELVLAWLVALSLLAIGLFFGAFALTLIYKDIRLWRRARSSRNWPATHGRVVSKRIAGVSGKNWHPIIEYAYLVNGVRYTGSRLAFEHFGYPLKQAEAILDRYMVGKSVPLYYDADNPQESTLELRHRGLGSSLLINAILLFSPTGFCLCVGLFGLADVLRK